MTSSRRHLLARSAIGALIATGIGLAIVAPARAHTECDPADVAPGSIVALNLFVENESSTAGTTIV